MGKRSVYFVILSSVFFSLACPTHSRLEAADNAQDLRAEISGLEARIKVLRREKEILEKEIVELWEFVAALSFSGPRPSKVPPVPPDFRAKVMEVEGELLMLSHGKDDGVVDGMNFSIWRGNKFLGRIKVLKVYKDFSGAVIESRKNNAVIKEGDDIRHLDFKPIDKFKPTVASLKQYQCPDWFRDAKFGIYLHWGAYSVARQGEWYARRLYEQGRPEYAHHLKTYGHPSKHGYKDFIPQWKAEKFDPDALLALFKRAGAKYFSPCAVHHDNFDLWNSKHHKWNAVNMGPKKDLIGMWRAATIKAGLKFGVTTHLSRSYSWLNVANQADAEGSLKGVPYDGAQGKAPGLYPPNDGQTIHPRAPLDPPKSWRDHWARRIKQLVRDYQPDHLYFDCAVPFRGEDQGRTGLDVIAYFLNQRPDGVMCVKERPWQGLYAEGITTLDYERGKASHILDAPWQTDDSIGSWGYNENTPYTTSDAVIDKLIDIVSKNGNMLLNIPILADGTLDETATGILEDMGKWFKVNGKGIYGTRPWYMFGEGKTVMPHKTIESPFTPRDIRYTTKGGKLYAFVLAWPGKRPVEMQFLAPGNQRIGKIRSVRLLGHEGDIEWEQHPDGLRVNFPSRKPCDFAYCLKIDVPMK